MADFGPWDSDKDFKSMRNALRDSFNPGGFVADYNDTVIALTFVNGTRTLTVAPASTDYYFWTVDPTTNAQKRHYKNANETVQISDTEGLHFVYFDENGDLAETTTWESNLLYRYTYVCVIYWDATNSQQIYIGFEQHGCTIDPTYHIEHHLTEGADLQEGGGLGNITSDDTGDDASHAQFSITQVIMWDEDIQHTINAKGLTDNIAVYYRLGADASDIWRVYESASFPVLLTGNVGEDRAAYNQNNAGTWQLTEVANNQFVLAHVFVFNDRSRGFGVIMGQATYANQLTAREGASTELASLTLRDVALEEYKFLGTLIIQTNDGYGNAVKSRIRTTDGGDDFIDWRSAVMPQGGTSSTVTDHGALGGLSDTDHPASAIFTDTSGWSGLLSASETTVQAALDVLDAISLTADNIVSGSASATITADGLDITDGSTTASINLSSGDLIIKNFDDGSDVYIKGEVATDTEKTIFKGAPDGAAELYYAGTVKIVTTTNGVDIGTAAAATTINIIGAEGNAGSIVSSDSNIILGAAGNVTISVAGGETAIFCKNNAGVELYYDNSLRLETTSTGVEIGDGTATAATIGFSDDDLIIDNNDVAGLIILKGEKTGPSEVTMASFDPDGAAELYYAGTKVFETGDTGGCLFARQALFPQTAITSSGNSVAWNLATAQAAIHTLTENTTIAAPSNQVAGATYTLKIVQAAGVYTLAWNAAFDFGAETASAEPAANGDVIVVSFYSDGTTMYAVEMIRVEV